MPYFLHSLSDQVFNECLIVRKDFHLIFMNITHYYTLQCNGKNNSGRIVFCHILNILLSIREDFRSYVLSITGKIINCIERHFGTHSNIILKLNEKYVADQVCHGTGLMEAWSYSQNYEIIWAAYPLNRTYVGLDKQ